MERPRGFFTKRTEHYNNIQKEENKKKAIEQSLTINPKEANKLNQQQQSSPSPKVENLDPNKSPAVNHTKTPNKERPLKCLETLAQKAGITFDEKYETALAMEKSQSPAQQVQQTQQIPLQILPEQLQQFQQFQIQQAFGGGTPTIQVKQEYATQQQQGLTAADIKSLQDQHMQQMQIVQESPQSPHQNSVQNALQQAVQNGQVPAEYLQQRVQVLQQPIQNTSYLQQMYSPQLLMSAAGNLLGHSGLGQQQIQLIAGKPFQNQLTQQMLSTAGGKPVLTTQGTQGFSYATLPTIPSSQSQTLLFSPVQVNGVISQSQGQQGGQQSILSSMQSQNTPNKNDNSQKNVGGQKVLQKVTTQNSQQQQQGQNVSNAQQQAANQQQQQQQQQQQCVQVSQAMPTAQILSGQAMQFTPWQLQGMTGPFWTTTANGIQPQTLVANPILIRGTNPDGTQMLFQQSPTTATTQQTVQSPHNQISLVGSIAQQTTTQKARPNTDTLGSKTQNQQRAAPILPQGAPIRPASSVSTQTQVNQNANMLAKTPKVRTKQTPVRPAAPNIKVSLNQQTQPATMMQQVVTPGVNKMVVMSNINGQLTPVLQQNTNQQILSNDNKMKVQQAQQQVILQQQFQQQIAQLQLQQQQQLLQSQGISQAQLMAAAQNAGGIQQVVLQPQQMQTVTVTSTGNLQTLPTQMTQQGIMTKAGNHPPILQMSQAVSTQNSSHTTSVANNHIVTSIAGSVTADTSNSILGPLSSPQTPLHPPQNPLIAMTTLSASPMSGGMQKEKADASSGDSNKIYVSTSVSSATISSSPLKRPAPEDDSKSDTKKQTENADSKKSEEPQTSISNSSVTSSPSSNNKNQQSTPNSSTKTQVASTGSNTPLTTQNGEADTKKATNNASTNSPLLKNELPKAMVKPNVLTHVIEGYVIQESSEPFPVTRQRYSEKENDEPPKKKQAVSDDSKVSESPKIVNGESSGVSSSTPIQAPTDMVACQHCGKQEMRSKLKRKHFCSLNCARTNKNASTDSSPVISASNGDEKSIEASPSHADKSKNDGNDSNAESQSIEEHVMMKWSVTQVCDFIKNLPGCTDYAEDFALQEIDGQALLLLKENHLVSAMGMKLGPALKIVNKIESMRVSKEAEQQGSDGSSDQSCQ